MMQYQKINDYYYFFGYSAEEKEKHLKYYKSYAKETSIQDSYIAMRFDKEELINSSLAMNEDYFRNGYISFPFAREDMKRPIFGKLVPPNNISFDDLLLEVEESLSMIELARLYTKMDYLGNYSDNPATCCVLYKDDNNDFFFTRTKHEEYWFNGGLIYSKYDNQDEGSYSIHT